MRVVLMQDRRFVQRERPLVTRLQVGLADEGWRVTQCVPESVWSELEPAVWAETVRWKDSGWRWTRGLRERELIGAVRACGGGSSVDVVHCMGQGVHGVGSRMAGWLGAALAVEVWRPGMGPALGALKARLGGEVALGAIAADAAYEAEIAAEGVRVGLAPWGVSAGGAAAGEVPAAAGVDAAGVSEGVGVLLTFEGERPAAVRACMAGLARVMGAATREVMLFVDAASAGSVGDGSGVWRWARELGITERVSVVAELESRRELLHDAAMVLVPEGVSAARSLVLGAMGHGQVVIAGSAGRPAGGVPEDGVSGVVVDAERAEAWERAIGRVLAEPAWARGVGAAARAWVQRERRVSGHVRGVIAAYEELVRAQRQIGRGGVAGTIGGRP